MNTPTCQQVYDLLQSLKQAIQDDCTLDTEGSVKLNDLVEKLSDAFCNFECSWKEHSQEYHE